jgi:hypothetical protein
MSECQQPVTLAIKQHLVILFDPKEKFGAIKHNFKEVTW